ncbi:hypothetical protein ACFL04_00460 [Patescibacteria group bacterium]
MPNKPTDVDVKTSTYTSVHLTVALIMLAAMTAGIAVVAGMLPLFQKDVKTAQTTIGTRPAPLVLNTLTDGMPSRDTFFVSNGIDYSGVKLTFLRDEAVLGRYPGGQFGGEFEPGDGVLTPGSGAPLEIQILVENNDNDDPQRFDLNPMVFSLVSNIGVIDLCLPETTVKEDKVFHYYFDSNGTPYYNKPLTRQAVGFNCKQTLVKSYNPKSISEITKTRDYPFDHIDREDLRDVFAIYNVRYNKSLSMYVKNSGYDGFIDQESDYVANYRCTASAGETCNENCTPIGLPENSYCASVAGSGFYQPTSEIIVPDYPPNEAVTKHRIDYFELSGQFRDENATYTTFEDIKLSREDNWSYILREPPSNCTDAQLDEIMAEDWNDPSSKARTLWGGNEPFPGCGGHNGYVTGIQLAFDSEAGHLNGFNLGINHGSAGSGTFIVTSLKAYTNWIIDGTHGALLMSMGYIDPDLPSQYVPANTFEITSDLGANTMCMPPVSLKGELRIIDVDDQRYIDHVEYFYDSDGNAYHDEFLTQRVTNKVCDDNFLPPTGGKDITPDIELTP